VEARLWHPFQEEAGSFMHYKMIITINNETI
jgi:hypothetical protein